MTGEQPLQGAVAVRFGSVISLCPSGSPGAVVGAGMGLRPSSVETIEISGGGTPSVPLGGGCFGTDESAGSNVAEGTTSDPEWTGSDGIMPGVAGSV